MIFSSLEFLCVFFPAVFLVHCILPSVPLKNAWLVGASLLFYAYGEPVYVLLMAGSVLLNYIAARGITALPMKKWVLWADIAVNLGILAMFKYAVFLGDVMGALFGVSPNIPEFALPIGISFFTFQEISYVVDVYRGKVEEEKNFGRLLLYVSFFPQLIAGPIVKYRDISAALENRKVEIRQAASGFRRFVCGLGKKVLIANTVGQTADAVFSAQAQELPMPAAWIGAMAYMLQIYYDFSGYSDMAVGLGRMFGFQFQENFRYPYGAAGIREFWHRWHISLSEWFKEYLYIPLGGNRKGKIRTGVNKFAVFFCTGLWHGADWTFVAWGLYHGLLSVLEDALPTAGCLPKALQRLSKALLRLYTLLAVCVGFVLFRAESLGQGLLVLKRMFAGNPAEGVGMGLAMQQLTPWFLGMAAVGLVGMAPIRPVADRIRRMVYGELPWAATGQDGNGLGNGQKELPSAVWGKGKDAFGAVWQGRPWSFRIAEAFLDLSSMAILLWCMFRLSGSTYNPFIYFRF